MQTLKQMSGWWLAMVAVLTVREVAAGDGGDPASHSGSAVVTVTASGGGSAAGGGGAGGDGGAIVVKSSGAGGGAGGLGQKDRTWLGVAIEEASEALASQLGLEPGVGLVVTYVAPDSPAAKAGLEKNDVLAELEGQALVHPAQLRKLVEVRKEGDSVSVVFYRGGKKQTASVKLGKTQAGFGLLEDDYGLSGTGHGFERLIGLSGGGGTGLNWHQGNWLMDSNALRGQLKVLRESAGRLNFDQQRIQEEVRRSMEQARKAYGEALRHSTNNSWGPVAKAFKELERSRIMLDKNPTVTVRSTGQGVKSLVKADDSGTIVIVSNPKPHLTAHDKDGKLLFDGEIDTAEQRDQVPRDLWEKVEPLLDKMAPKAEDEVGTGVAPSKRAPSGTLRLHTPPGPRKTPTV